MAFRPLVVLSLLLTLLVGAPAPTYADHHFNGKDGQTPEHSPIEEASHDHEGLLDKPPVKELLPLEDLRAFTKAYETIRAVYVEEIDDKKLLEYAIRGMLGELDPHSAYLDESSFEDLQVNTTGEFGGLGIEVGMEDGFVKVVSPIDDTPAERAGIDAGDLIIKIDDSTVKGLSLNEAVNKMRGPTGTDIKLTIVREGEDQPLEFVITRDIIKVKSVRSEVLEEHFGYIRIAQFQLHTGPNIIDAVEKMRAENDIKGFILDLRNNPGGVLQASVDVAGAFLKNSMVVYTEGRFDDSNEKYYADANDVTDGIPIVVLINDGSASASEIVAGALQDHSRAVIIGTRSFGKGSVQTVIPITEEKAIKLTTALYFTPKGRSIQAHGIEPDISVERVRVTAIKKRSIVTEAELSGRLDNTQGKENENAKQRQDEQRTKQENFQNKDNQLYEALNLLKGLSILSNAQNVGDAEEKRKEDQKENPQT